MTVGSIAKFSGHTVTLMLCVCVLCVCQSNHMCRACTHYIVYVWVLMLVVLVALSVCVCLFYKLGLLVQPCKELPIAID